MSPLIERHVVAHARQRAEIDLGETQPGDGVQGLGQGLVAEADGRTAQRL
jgi:hypothetical protein